MALLNEPAVRLLLQEHHKVCGRRVFDRRKSLNLKQADLAALTGLTQATISHIELGHKAPRDHIKVMIAAALSCSVEELFPHPDRIQIANLIKAAAA